MFKSLLFYTDTYITTGLHKENHNWTKCYFQCVMQRQIAVSKFMHQLVIF